MPKQVAYLGPEGTFAEKAAVLLAEQEGIANAKFIPCIGLRSVVEHAATKRCDWAVVPVENSVEGGVSTTLDALWSNPELAIVRSLVLPIRHALLSNGNLSEISEVLSHPQALAQCSNWLNQNLPNALQLSTTSTSEAVRMVKGSHFRAAIASSSAGRVKGLNELAFPINDAVGNRTRFLLLRRGARKNKGNLASLAFSLHANAPGALLEALSCVARLGLNMSRIESRPSKRELGEYVFFIDVEINDLENDIQHELENILNPLCEHLVLFGAYPNSHQDLD